MKSAVLLPVLGGILFVGTWDIAIRWSGGEIEAELLTCH